MAIQDTIKDLQNLEDRQKKADETFAAAEKIQREAYQMKSDSERELARAQAIKDEAGKVALATDMRLKDREEAVRKREDKVVAAEAQLTQKINTQSSALTQRENDLRAAQSKLEKDQRALAEKEAKTEKLLKAAVRLSLAVKEFSKEIN